MRRATGSNIDKAGIAYYQRLCTYSGHCDGAIRMMANWRLEALQARLPNLASPVYLIHAANDRAIPRASVYDAAALMPCCEVEELPDLGHLAHEEDADRLGAIIVTFAKQHLKG